MPLELPAIRPAMVVGLIHYYEDQSVELEVTQGTILNTKASGGVLLGSND
jgi:hypothetical protein